MDVARHARIRHGRVRNACGWDPKRSERRTGSHANDAINAAPTLPWTSARPRLPSIRLGDGPDPLPRSPCSDAGREAAPTRNGAHVACALRLRLDPRTPTPSNAGACRSRHRMQAPPAAPIASRVLRRSRDRSRRVHGAPRRAKHAWPCRKDEHVRISEPHQTSVANASTCACGSRTRPPSPLPIRVDPRHRLQGIATWPSGEEAPADGRDNASDGIEMDVANVCVPRDDPIHGP